jgi:dephospho-CoA kinase
MKVIGLTGSIAMGKSEVAKIIRARGIPVFDADAEVHTLYDSQEGANLLRPLVPDAVKNNRVDRPALSQIVLADPALLNRLEKIVHAEIARRRSSFIEQAKALGHEFVVLDIPLLFETAAEKSVDETIVVSAPEHFQHARAKARPGMTDERLVAILARQMPDAEKRKRATHILENDGTLAELARKTGNLLDQLMRDQNA